MSHASIDRQLRGRSARQGIPVTRFYVSLEDNLMRLFGSEKFLWDYGKARYRRGRGP